MKGRILKVFYRLAILLAGYFLFLVTSKFLDEARLYQEAEQLMPPAYRFSEAVNRFFEINSRPPETEQEIREMLLSPETSLLKSYRFHLVNKEGAVVAFNVNRRFNISIGRFYPESSDQFLPQMQSIPR